MVICTARSRIATQPVAAQWGGHGRQLLAATLWAMRSEEHRRFSLDVATDNPQALSLYASCGFRQVEVYDYHYVPLADPEKSMP